MQLKKGVLVIIFLISIGVVSAAFTPSFPWHALQQISGDNGITSVDANQDGIIDNSSSCTGDSVCETNNILATGNLTLGNGIIAFNDTSNSYYYYYNGTEWKEFGSGGSFLSPTGTINAFYSTTCPQGWIPADGTAGTPDMRGMFIRGLNTFDDGITTRADGEQDPSSRSLGDYQVDNVESHSHSVNDPGHVHYAYTSLTLYALPAGSYGSSYGGGSAYATTGAATGISINTYGSGTETTVKNVGMIYCMKVAGDVNTSNYIWGESANNVYVLNDSKNIGIGTNTPTQKLHVEGNLNVTGIIYGNASGITGVNADYATTAGSASSATNVAWGGITGMPAGFSDGIDNTGGCTLFVAAAGTGTTVAVARPAACVFPNICQIRGMAVGLFGEVISTEFGHVNGNQWATSSGTSGTDGAGASSEPIVQGTRTTMYDDVPFTDFTVGQWNYYCQAGYTCYYYAC